MRTRFLPAALRGRRLPTAVLGLALTALLAAGESRAGELVVHSASGQSEQAPVFRIGTRTDPLLALRREAGALVVEAKRGGIVIPIEPVTLEAAGQGVEVTFKVVFEGADNAAGGFRAGFFGLPGEGLVREDLPGVDLQKHLPIEGYLAILRLASRSVSKSEIIRRNGTEPFLFSPADAKVLGSVSEAMDVTPGTEYEGRLVVERTGADEVAVSVGLSGRPIAVATDSGGGMVTQFNLIGFFFSNARPAPEEGVKAHFNELKIRTYP